MQLVWTAAGAVIFGGEWDPITALDVENASRAIASSTAHGADDVGPDLFRALPLEAHQELADLLNAAERYVSWPWQAFLALVVMLPKPGGWKEAGERPITLMTMLYRIWSHIRKTCAQEWCDARAGAWDDAVRRGSPLRCVLRRIIDDEAATALGDATAGIYWDVEKFYDSISLVLLFQRAADLGFPEVLLAMSAMAYTGTRVITADSVYGESIAVSSSIPAGCANANHGARIFLYPLLEHLSIQHPRVVCNQWVDDVVMRAHGAQGVVHLELTEAAMVFAGSLAQDGLKVSIKQEIRKEDLCHVAQGWRGTSGGRQCQGPGG